MGPAAQEVLTGGVEPQRFQVCLRGRPQVLPKGIVQRSLARVDLGADRRDRGRIGQVLAQPRLGLLGQHAPRSRRLRLGRRGPQPLRRSQRRRSQVASFLGAKHGRSWFDPD
jgi:hypothetical protein